MEVLHRAFPEVRIVTAACEPTIEEITIVSEEHLTEGTDKEKKQGDGSDGGQHHDRDRQVKKVWAIIPDAGAIGDRYYGA